MPALAGLLMVVGFGIFAGNVLARTVGVFAAIGSMLTPFSWLPWYPVWTVITIAPLTSSNQGDHPHALRSVKVTDVDDLARTGGPGNDPLPKPNRSVQ